KDIVSNHVITADFEKYPESLRRYEDQLRGRSIIVSKADMVPIECVVRGYLSGSGWKDYQKTGAVCGIGLPAGLRESDKLPEPIFTPATKAQEGHDENIDFEGAAELIGDRGLAARLRDISIAVSEHAAAHALER